MTKQLTLKVKREVYDRACGDGNVPLCEKCRGIGDFRGLEYAHWPPKGMGGTKRRYTKDNMKLLCAKCHHVGDHGIREV